MDDLISRQAAIKALRKGKPKETEYRGSCADSCGIGKLLQYESDISAVIALPSTQPERLTDDDFETIRIHLSAFKEKLCNQHRWKEAEEYQRIIDRFVAFASAQRKGKWIKVKPINGDGDIEAYMCPFCKTGDWDISVDSYNYCPYCGKSVSGVADDPSHPFVDDVMMEGEGDGRT